MANRQFEIYKRITIDGRTVTVWRDTHWPAQWWGCIQVKPVCRYYNMVWLESREDADWTFDHWCAALRKREENKRTA